MRERDVFESISPIDYRYWDEETAEYLSENGFTRYKLLVERALAQVLYRRGICSHEVFEEIGRASRAVSTEEVYEEERRVGHDIRALVNCVRGRVSDAAKPYVHLTATSYDVIDSANAARLRDAVQEVLIPALIALEEALIEITLHEARTVQIGRTHGQHAVPITFGFALAGYVSRLGGSIVALKARAGELVGKFSGAVGAYNASSLLFDDPEKFEAEVLAEFGLLPAEHSTQIVPPEALLRLFSEVTIAAGVLANLADDMRHLERTEIGEVCEVFGEEHVGSSTMPHKRNPVNFENAKSLWKVVVSRIVTVFLDQISEHQRDLTNSASSRTYGEIIAYVVSSAQRLTRTMRKLTVDRENVKRNLAMESDVVVAEPLYILLAVLGHPDAHEKVQLLALTARREQQTLMTVARRDVELQPYFARMTVRQLQILSDPLSYTGIAAKKAEAVAKRWKATLKNLKLMRR